MIDKNKIIELAKSRGLDIVEETIENLCHLGVDIVKELAKASPIALAVLASLEPTVRKAIDAIDIDGDGQ